MNELKASNLKLGRNLEDAMDRYEMLANQKTDLENKIESMQVRRVYNAHICLEVVSATSRFDK